MNVLNKLERKFGRYYIPNLMLYIVIGNIVVFVFQYLFPEFNFEAYMNFDRELIMQGQVWRILSFVLVPFSTNPIFMLISCYFYYLIGSQLEQVWGGFRFNVFYIVGVIGTIICGLISGYATAYYLNLSLFLAFAILFPNERFLLFYFIPVKAKWLAWIDVAFLSYNMIISFAYGFWASGLCILISFLNIALFFGGNLISRIRINYKAKDVRKAWRDVRIKMSENNDDENNKR